MKKNFLPALKLTALCLILLTVVYPLTVWGVAQLTSGAGKGQTIEQNGRKYYINVGQKFTDDRYFWSRPSAVEYDAAASGGSNKGASNKEYLQLVQARIDTFLRHNPEVKTAEVPVELVTASASGLDPHISVRAAEVQIKRVAKARKVQEDELKVLIENHTQGPLLGIFGPQKINVLQLNLALNEIDK